MNALSSAKSLFTRVLTVLFLRLFAFNLGRTFRNTPDKACYDAFLQMTWSLAFPYLTILSPIVILTPELRRTPANLQLFFLVAALLFVFPFMSWLQRKFGRYEKTPEAAEIYRNSRKRLKTLAALVLNPLIWFGIMVSCFHIF